MEIPAAISIEEARALIVESVKPGRVETVSPVDALGRVIAADLFSDIDVTPFDDSAMDGFCMRSADLEAASEDAPVTLTCVAHIGAGSHYDEEIQPGQCARIMTGAPVPAGADTVVKIEIVSYAGDGSVGDAITFTAPSKPWNNIRKAGEEAKAGDKIIEAGDVISPAGAGLLASTGNLQVPVYARPKVGLFTIGSELVDASEVPGPGMIRDSNVFSIAAYIKAAGGEPVIYGRVSDAKDDIEAAFKRAVAECDMVVSTGGACAGDFDYTPIILNEMGRIVFFRVSMKPGKSQPFGIIDDKPVFVLSGNPGASAMGFEIFVRPALRLLQGYTTIDHPEVMARLTSDVKKKDPRVFMNRGYLGKDPETGEYVVSMYANQSSGLYGSLQKADVLVVFGEGAGVIEAGTKVRCILNRVDEGCIL